MTNAFFVALPSFGIQLQGTTLPAREGTPPSSNQLMVNWWCGLVVWDSNQGTPK